MGRHDSFGLPASSEPADFANVMGTLFFRANDGRSGFELWKSDGTATGTVLVKDIRPGPDSSSPLELTNANGTLLFRADDGTNGSELWKSNGTAAGTALVKDICPRSCSPFALLVGFTNVRGVLFFPADDGRTGSELWKSDGTAAGTTLVKDIRPGLDSLSGPFSSFPAELTNVNGRLFFRADDGASGFELWKSDGTARGTVLVKDIRPGSESSSPSGLTNVKRTFSLRAGNATTRSELPRRRYPRGFRRPALGGRAPRSEGSWRVYRALLDARSGGLWTSRGVGNV
jgi:ELWxxDGT repeat protein